MKVLRLELWGWEGLGWEKRIMDVVGFGRGEGVMEVKRGENDWREEGI